MPIDRVRGAGLKGSSKWISGKGKRMWKSPYELISDGLLGMELARKRIPKDLVPLGKCGILPARRTTRKRRKHRACNRQETPFARPRLSRVASEAIGSGEARPPGALLALPKRIPFRGTDRRHGKPVKTVGATLLSHPPRKGTDRDSISAERTIPRHQPLHNQPRSHLDAGRETG